MIREITKNDLASVNALLSTFNYSISWNNITNTFLKCLLYINNDIANGVLVYQQIYDRIEIDYIIVNREYLKRGIATSLMNYLIDDALKKDIKNITLEVNANNKAAIHLYKKFNFKVICRREKYYGTNDGLLMLRKFDNNER